MRKISPKPAREAAKRKSSRRESSPRLPVYKTGALTVELREVGPYFTARPASGRGQSLHESSNEPNPVNGLRSAKYPGLEQGLQAVRTRKRRQRFARTARALGMAQSTRRASEIRKRRVRLRNLFAKPTAFAQNITSSSGGQGSRRQPSPSLRGSRAHSGQFVWRSQSAPRSENIGVRRTLAPAFGPCKGGEIELKGDVKVGEEECREIYMKFPDTGAMTWAVSKKDMLPRKVTRIVKGEEGEATTELVISDLVVNPQFVRNPFEMICPEGFKKTDDFAP